MKEALPLKTRTRDFSLRVIRFYATLTRSTEAQILGKQLLRSATSVGAQYREAQRAKSDADFISKVEVSLQEAEETLYWLELLQGAHIGSAPEIEYLQNETNELIAMLVTVVRRVKERPRR
jgi:four helix bundle protein